MLDLVGTWSKEILSLLTISEPHSKRENLLLYTANFVYKSVSNFVYISRGQIKEEICIHERSTQC